MTEAVVRTSHLVVGGAALAREDSGRVLFVDGALGDEEVRVAIAGEKKDFAAARVTEVITASADRVEPPCATWHRGCGGCDWQHIDPTAQLGLKVGIVREALTRTGRLREPNVVAGGAVAPWGYRTTVRVAADAGGRLGFRAARSHQVIATDDCLIAASGINALLAERRAQPGSDVTLRVDADDRPCSPDAAIVVEVADVALRVSASSFFQSSPAAAELLVEAAARAVRGVPIEQATVIDAYGGIGLFAATVARNAGHVIVVESSPSSINDARHNLADRLRDGTAAVHEQRMEDWRATPAQIVIADPPRAGLGRIGVDQVVATGAIVVALVSCDAGSLARDARLLGDHGYRHEGTEVIDVFPNTSHIEAVTRFVRGDSSS